MVMQAYLITSLCFMVAGISDGNKHLHTDLPCFIAGGGSGTHKGGRHIFFFKAIFRLATCN